MQSDVPPLPIACLTTNLRLARTSNSQAKQLAVHSNKSTSVFRNKKHTSKPHLPRNLSRPAVGPLASPYKSNARLIPTDTAKPLLDKSAINQRVSSAKMLRIKQLQNQLADAHFHLNELSNENKLLKAIQKRQDAALKRYEGTNAELPRIINTHHEDVRVLQTKYKKLKSQYNSLSDTLKEKDNELHSLQVQNKKLLQLSKDRHLGERDKLQTQVFDLTHRISEQDETIQTCKRKLELETKYLKHQLHVEMVKHKESLAKLEQANAKLQHLERLNEQRLKRSYQARQLTSRSKARDASVTSLSLVNLSDAQSENAFTLHRKLSSESTVNQSLPCLNGASSTSSRLQDVSKRSNLDRHSTITESFASLESNSSFRVAKSPALHRPAPPLTCSRSTAKNDSVMYQEFAQQEANVQKLSAGKKTCELPKSLKREFDYSTTDDERSINDSRLNSNDSLSDNFTCTSRSRSLHARLVNSATDGVRTNKTAIASRSRSLTKENLEHILENDGQVKYDCESVITVISKHTSMKGDNEANTNDSNSDIESEMEIPVAYIADKDDDVDDDDGQRISDVIIEDVQVQKQSKTSLHLSSLFTHLRKPLNYTFNSKTSQKKSESNVNQINKKEINGLTIPSKNIDEYVDGIVDYKRHSIIAKTSWDDDLSVQDENKQDSDENVRSGSDEVSKDQENDIASLAEKLLIDVTENLRETIKLENDKTDQSNCSDMNQNKASLVYSKKSDDAAERKTEENKSANKSFDKAKLLAAMRAIDDNENIEFVDQKPRKNSASNRLRITENLYRGLPTHKKKSKLMKELFSDANLDNNKNENY